jgi:dihydroorotase-like cyclic amidohydrolase
VFDPLAKWTLAAGALKSRSQNTPFAGYRFTGKPLGIVHRGQTTL